MGHEFLSIYTAKAAEYLLAVSYLLLFIPFWRYVQGTRRAPVMASAQEAKPRVRQADPAAAAKPARRPAPRPTAGWFEVPAGVWLHPGHTWARLEDDGTVAIGLDDLAHRLVAAELASAPPVGASVVQGEAAISLLAGGRSVSALSPVDGTVTAVNPAALDAHAAACDPYGAGWLFKVQPTRLPVNLRQLHGGAGAKRLLEDASELLAVRADPGMAAVLQDGGTPVHGIAEAVAGDRWDELASELLRS
jgi:glycine cleavage system H protein